MQLHGMPEKLEQEFWNECDRVQEDNVNYVSKLWTDNMIWLAGYCGMYFICVSQDLESERQGTVQNSDQGA